MNTKTLAGLTLLTGAFIIAVTVPGQAQNVAEQSIKLQSATPGTAQSGHGAITGTFKAGYLKGNGLGVTGINANNVAVGTLNDDRLSANVPLLNKDNAWAGKAVFNDFVGIGRTSPLVSDEAFGITGKSPNGAGVVLDSAANTSSYFAFFSGGKYGCSTLYDSLTNIWRLSIAGSDTGLTFNGAGNLALGMSTPNERLSVRGVARIYDTKFTGKIAFIPSNSSNAGAILTSSSNGGTNVAISTSAAWTDRGAVTVYSNTVPKAAVQISPQGQGQVVADVKNFCVPNPRNDAEDIYYASLEGPEAAAYVRGTGKLINGRAYVTLPQHFQDIALLEGMTIQITPQSLDSRGLAAFDRTLTGFSVGELAGGKGNYLFDWEVKCVRQGHEDYKVIRDWRELLPSGADAKAIWPKRLESIREAQAQRSRKVTRP